MKQVIRMVLFVLIIGSILTAVLLAVDNFTQPVIAANQRISVRENVLLALGVPAGDDVDATFDSSVSVEDVDGITLYTASDGTRAIPYGGNGLWGPISGILAVTPDGSEISGVTIIHQEETPGLGGRIAESEFLGLFTGIGLDTPMEVVAAGKAASEFQIDSITGATLSTVVFVDLLNEHIAEAQDVLRGGTR